MSNLISSFSLNQIGHFIQFVIESRREGTLVPKVPTIVSLKTLGTLGKSLLGFQSMILCYIKVNSVYYNWECKQFISILLEVNSLRDIEVPNSL